MASFGMELQEKRLEISRVIAIEYSGDLLVISNPDSKTLAHIKGKATAASCSPKGDIVAVGDQQGWVRLFNTKTGDLIQVLGRVGDETKTADVAFSPDGAF